MTKQQEIDEKHLEWLVENRSKNSGHFYGTFKNYYCTRKKLEKSRHYSTAQELLGVAFSLWPSVFLADKSGEPGSSLKDAKTFLATMLRDNAITYSQDRMNNNWSFNFYITVAKNHLEALNKKFPGIFADGLKVRESRARWEHLQAAFEAGVTQFGEVLTQTK